jgi:hypothetical protein
MDKNSGENILRVFNFFGGDTVGASAGGADKATRRTAFKDDKFGGVDKAAIGTDYSCDYH